MSRKLTLRRKDEHTLVLGGLDGFLSALLLEVRTAGVPNPESEGRLFQTLTGGREEEADEDWREFIRPEMEAEFSETRNRVSEDLRSMRDMGSKGTEVEIPLAHAWEWVHGLNQARLALATIHKIGEEEMEEKAALKGAAAMAAFQIQFYGLLQEWLLAEMGED